MGTEAHFFHPNKNDTNLHNSNNKHSALTELTCAQIFDKKIQ